jgi:hypothetical protein
MLIQFIERHDVLIEIMWLTPFGYLLALAAKPQHLDSFTRGVAAGELGDKSVLLIFLQENTTA